MLYIEPELNSIIIDDNEFNLNHNYMPEFVLALRELNPEKEIHFVVDLKKAPVIFIVYFRKLKETNNDLDLSLYFSDTNPLLPKILSSYNLDFNTIDKYPFDLPSAENVTEVVDQNSSWMALTSDSDSCDNSKQKINVEHNLNDKGH